MVNKLTKQGYFILYIEKMSVKKLLEVYMKEVFIKYRVLVKIISDKDLKFISAFQEVFIAKQETQVVMLIVYYLQTDRQIK